MWLYGCPLWRRSGFVPVLLFPGVTVLLLWVALALAVRFASAGASPLRLLCVEQVAYSYTHIPLMQSCMYLGRGAATCVAATCGSTTTDTYEFDTERCCNDCQYILPT